MVTTVAMGLTALSSLYLAHTVAVPQENRARPSHVASFRRLPSTYWQLILIYILGYGGINTFTNSAQRFLAARFFHDDQSTAGAALRYVL